MSNVRPLGRGEACHALGLKRVTLQPTWRTKQSSGRSSPLFSAAMSSSRGKRTREQKSPPTARASAKVNEELDELMRRLGAPRVEVSDVLKLDEGIAAALVGAAQPKPRVKNGNDAVLESEALSKMIACEQQASRGELVKFFLGIGFCSWPPPGCAFSTDILPPLLAAIEGYDTYRDEDEWEGIFELLLEEGNADREWGPDYVTASSLFFRKFNRNID